MKLMPDGEKLNEVGNHLCMKRNAITKKKTTTKAKLTPQKDKLT